MRPARGDSASGPHNDGTVVLEMDAVFEKGVPRAPPSHRPKPLLMASLRCAGEGRTRRGPPCRRDRGHLKKKDVVVGRSGGAPPWLAPWAIRLRASGGPRGPRARRGCDGARRADERGRACFPFPCAAACGDSAAGTDDETVVLEMVAVLRRSPMAWPADEMPPVSVSPRGPLCRPDRDHLKKKGVVVVAVGWGGRVPSWWAAGQVGHGRTKGGQRRPTSAGPRPGSL